MEELRAEMDKRKDEFYIKIEEMAKDDKSSIKVYLRFKSVKGEKEKVKF